MGMIKIILSALFGLTAGLPIAFAAPPQPIWKHGDNYCPPPSAVDNYLQVPLFHDLAAGAEISRIPGLDVFADAQKEYAGKTMKIYFESFRPWDASKKLLILVPGGPGQTHADLHGLADIYESKTDLFKHFNVIAMDHRGVGCSRPFFPGNEPPESMLMRQAASDIEAIRTVLAGPDGSISVWGYSYGSLLAQTYALLYPQHLDRLFLGGTVSGQDDWHLAAMQFESLVYSGVTPQRRQEFESAVAAEPELRQNFLDWSFAQLYEFRGRTVRIPEKINAVLATFNSPDPVTRAALSKEMMGQGEIAPWMSRSIACIELFPYTAKFQGEYPLWSRAVPHCDEFRGRHQYFDYTGLLKQIAAPTLIYGGAFDHVTPPKAAIRMAQEIDGSFLYIDNFLGHGLGGKIDCLLQLTSKFFIGASREELDLLTYSPICQQVPSVE